MVYGDKFLSINENATVCFSEALIMEELANTDKMILSLVDESTVLNEGFGQVVSTIFNAIKNAIISVGKFIKEKVIAFFKMIGKFFEKIFGALKKKKDSKAKGEKSNEFQKDFTAKELNDVNNKTNELAQTTQTTFTTVNSTIASGNKGETKAAETKAADTKVAGTGLSFEDFDKAMSDKNKVLTFDKNGASFKDKKPEAAPKAEPAAPAKKETTVNFKVYSKDFDSISDKYLVNMFAYIKRLPLVQSFASSFTQNYEGSAEHAAKKAKDFTEKDIAAFKDIYSPLNEFRSKKKNDIFEEISLTVDLNDTQDIEVVANRIKEIEKFMNGEEQRIKNITSNLDCMKANLDKDINFYMKKGDNAQLKSYLSPIIGRYSSIYSDNTKLCTWILKNVIEVAKTNTTTALKIVVKESLGEAA